MGLELIGLKLKSLSLLVHIQQVNIQQSDLWDLENPEISVLFFPPALLRYSQQIKIIPIQGI